VERDLTERLEQIRLLRKQAAEKKTGKENP
jgi:hypothetical protein